MRIAITNEMITRRESKQTMLDGFRMVIGREGRKEAETR